MWSSMQIELTPEMLHPLSKDADSLQRVQRVPQVLVLSLL